MQQSVPIVKIAQGPLSGRVLTGQNAKRYYAFQGIPYAKPPLGDLRFKAPAPPDSWTETRDATEEKNGCYSIHIFNQEVVGSEDCLYLNVYTPSLNSDSLPVMVWIHGGGFAFGSGNSDVYSPDFLISHDIIIITINYRVGLFGFLSFNNPTIGVPGNAGLKDQVMALRWVKENIRSFGGNPKNVTIFGESAGGASVDFLVLSPMAKGLFHKAIIQSGSALSHWAVGSGVSSAIAKALNRETASEREIFETVKEFNSVEVLELFRKIPCDYNVAKETFFGPVIESTTSEKPFMTQHPLEVLKSGNYNHVPIIIGYCDTEGYIFYMLKHWQTGTYDNLNIAENNVPFKFKRPEKEKFFNTVAENIKNVYFNGNNQTDSDSTEYFQLQSDVFFSSYINYSIKLLLTTSKHAIYCYRVSVDTKLNLTKKILNIQKPGVSHFDDVFYLFKSDWTPSISPSSLEAKSIYRFTKLWTNFARNGNPNPTEKDEFIDVTWMPTKSNNLKYLNIGDKLTVGENPDQKRLDLWVEMFNF